IAAIGLVLLPNPMDQVLAQRRADHSAQAHAVATIAAAQKKLAAAPSPAPVDPQVQKILQDTQAKVAAAPDPRAALQNITPAEHAKALAQAAQQSQDPAMAASLQQASSAIAGGDAAAAAAALNNVASQLDSLQQQENNDQEIAAAINGLEAARQQLAAQADRDAGQASASGSTGASPGSA